MEQQQLDAARAFALGYLNLEALPEALEWILPPLAEALLRTGRSVRAGDVAVTFDASALPPHITQALLRFARLRF